MCGIVGIRYFDGRIPDPLLLRVAAAQIAHRGPDGEGQLVVNHVGFGHRRLAIIDLTQSTQPMTSTDGRTHVTFNGEILNYRQLREGINYRFRTSGDTETLLALHIAEGPRAVERLVGQFAYGLYDEGTDDLWLYRDRVGVLPLYYFADDNHFAFASEIKGLLALIDRSVAVDLESLGAYLTQRSVPAPWTLFEGVRKLPAGHCLRVSATNVGAPEPYWRLPTAADELEISADEATTRLSDTLKASVTRNLVADVPVGAYLSGGVDSSLVVAMASSLDLASGLETFAAGFGDPRHDELSHARAVSDLFNTQRLWAPLTRQRDAPVSEASDIAVHQLALLARQRVKAVLSGEGSDELFGGYPKARHAKLTAYAGVVPTSVRAPVLTWLERAMPRGGARARIAMRALSAPTEADRLATWFASFTPAERAALLGPRSIRPEPPPAGDDLGDPLRRMLVFDVGGWLSDNLLERADRMAMAASLEMRPPFLDRDVVELAFRLPSRLKIRNGQTKWIVKQVARRYLPNEIVDRRKVGFKVPLDVWFRSGLREFAADKLLDPRSFAQEVFDPAVIKQLIDNHLSARRDEELRIWTLLCLEVWHDVFFKHPVHFPK
jgi:asparagine synthase (glutamine-hydrolysing)